MKVSNREYGKNFLLGKCFWKVWNAIKLNHYTLAYFFEAFPNLLKNFHYRFHFESENESYFSIVVFTKFVKSPFGGGLQLLGLILAVVEWPDTTANLA